MKKFVVAVVIIGVFILYSFTYNHANSVAVLPNNTTSSSTRTGSSDTASATPAGASTSNGTSPTPDATSVFSDTPPTATPGTTTTPGSLYKDGSYTGSVADAYWGNIQVKAIIKSGKITDVQFLQYPNERNRSIAINNYADPQLTSEAIQAQSASVDAVTGATDTSDAFVQSLTDALSQAKA